MPTDLEGDWPGLVGSGYARTSVETKAYNCIAWAAGDEERWWQPLDYPHTYWPEGAPRELTVSAFEIAFQSLGYARVADGELVQGIEKIAIFGLSNGEPTHMARQLESGEWTSKLGAREDVSHPLRAVQGRAYGSVAVFLGRTRS